MKQFLPHKHRLVQHIIKNHIGYTMGALVMLTSTLVYADYKIPDFHTQGSHLQGNLLEVMLDTYEPPQVLLPKAGDTYTSGEVMPIVWQGKGKETNLYLIPQNQSQKTLLIEKYVKGNEFHWQVPLHIETGPYRVGIKNGSDLAKSNGFLTLKKPDQLHPDQKNEEPQPVLNKKEDKEQKHSQNEAKVDRPSNTHKKEESAHVKNSVKSSSDTSKSPKFNKDLQGYLLEAEQKNLNEQETKKYKRAEESDKKPKKKEDHKDHEFKKEESGKEKRKESAQSLQEKERVQNAELKRKDEAKEEARTQSENVTQVGVKGDESEIHLKKELGNGKMLEVRVKVKDLE